MNPKISIIVPCYNHAGYLNQTLQSVFEQTYLNYECLIIDDGSADNTESVARTWVTRDNRFSYQFQNNAGVSSARNNGIAEAKGDFILPLDADDIIMPSYVKKAIDQFKEFPTLKLVYCKAEKFGLVNEEWELRPFSLRNLAKGNQIFNSAVFRKTEWERIGGYDNKLLYGYEDWDFWINMLKDGGEVHQIPEILFLYRIKDSSRNKDISENQFEEIYKYLSKKYSDFFVDHLGSFQQLNQEVKSYKEEIKKMRRREKKLKENIIFKVLNKLGVLDKL